MLEINVDLKQLVYGLEDREDLLKLLVTAYANDAYGLDIDDMESDLSDINHLVSNEDDDLLINIQNTFANADKEFGEYEDDEEEDYEEEDSYWDESDACECGVCDECTQHLIEENRKKNEAALGL